MAARGPRKSSFIYTEPSDYVWHVPPRHDVRTTRNDFRYADDERVFYIQVRVRRARRAQALNISGFVRMHLDTTYILFFRDKKLLGVKKQRINIAGDVR